MSPLGLKARVSSLIRVCRGVCVTCPLRFTFGVTRADLLAASMAAELSLPRTCEALVGLENRELSCRLSQCEIRQTLCTAQQIIMFLFYSVGM